MAPRKTNETRISEHQLVRSPARKNVDVPAGCKIVGAEWSEEAGGPILQLEQPTGPGQPLVVQLQGWFVATSDAFDAGGFKFVATVKSPEKERFHVYARLVGEPST